jgi:two-component sensor histidine kinase
MLDTWDIPTGPNLLITEMNHRWFNGLQVISSSLRLCGQREGSAIAIEDRLLQLSDQVHAMAALHRRLSGPPPFDQTFEAYCRSLCLDVIHSFGRLDVTPWLVMDQPNLTPRGEYRLALLVVELMTNALKHGRAPKSGATVWFTLKPLGPCHLELTVRDNFDPPDPNLLSPKLVQALVEDLRGALDVDVFPTYLTRVRLPVL